MEKLFSLEKLLEAYDRERNQRPHLKDLEPLTKDKLRYYQQQGLFQPDRYQGKEVRYAEEALWRILFTKLFQAQSARVLKMSLTLPEIAKVLQQIDPSIVRSVALGEEPLSIGVITPQDGWISYSSHPKVHLEVHGVLDETQSHQLNLIAKLLETIVDKKPSK